MSTPLSATPNEHSFPSPIGLNSNRSPAVPLSLLPSPSPRHGSFSSQPQPIAGPSRLRTQSPITHYPPLPNTVPSPQNGLPTQGGQAVDQLHQARVALAQQVGAQNGQHQAGAQNGQERKTSAPPDWSNMAATMGMLNGQGLSREAMIKQLQALQNTAGGRARLATIPPASPVNGNVNGVPSPVNYTAPSPAAPSPANAPSPIPSTPHNPPTPSSYTVPLNATPQSDGRTSAPPRPPIPIGLNGPGSAPDQQLSDAQKAHLAVRAENIRAANRAASARPPVTNGRPPQPNKPPDVAASRAAFQRTITDYYRACGTPPPPEVWANGGKEGAINVCGTWVYLLDLFMLVMKYGGLQTAVKIPDVWKNLVMDQQIPDPLPEPVALLRPPRSEPATPATMTTNAVAYLMSIYQHHLVGFEVHLAAQTAKKRQQYIQAQAQAQAQATSVLPGRPPQSVPGSHQPNRPPPHTQPGQPAQMASVQQQADRSQARPPPQPTQSASQIQPQHMPSSQYPNPTPGPQPINLQQPRQSPISVIPTTAMPDPNMPPILTTSSPAQPQTPQNDPVKPPNPKKGKTKDGKSVPAPIKVDTAYGNPLVSAAAAPISGVETAGKKRKREKDTSKGANDSSGPSTPAPEPSTSTVPVERPSTPKRIRYKVEYKPLHLPLPTLAGWDSRAVTSTFPTRNMKQPARSAYELGIVDMEAVLMGLRSRLPRELGYALTALSMLSMPHPDDRSGGLPLISLMEVYEEILEVVEEACFGEVYEVWLRSVEKRGSAGPSCFSGDLNMVDFASLERVGLDLDWSMDDDEEVRSSRPRDNTGGSTDIVLAGINLLRNLTMLPENQHIMGGHPGLFRLISKITDVRLARLPGERDYVGRPYSIHELARVRRDSTTILGNIGLFVDLRHVDFEEGLSVMRMLSGFITCGWEYATRDSIYGPVVSTRDIPIHGVSSVNRALETFVKLAAADSNREILSKIPHDELMGLFDGLIRLLPSTPRAMEALYTQEDQLILAEYVSHALYSLAFLSPQSTRTVMRSTPGTLKLLTRIIYDTATKGYEFKTNPFNVFCRRLCETLGVLNSTVGGAGVESVGFGAGAGGGKGWRYNSEVVEKGWLCGMEEEVQRFLGVFGLDGPAFGELDGMWWAGDGM